MPGEMNVQEALEAILAELRVVASHAPDPNEIRDTLGLVGGDDNEEEAQISLVHAGALVVYLLTEAHYRKQAEGLVAPKPSQGLPKPKPLGSATEGAIVEGYAITVGQQPPTERDLMDAARRVQRGRS